MKAPIRCKACGGLSLRWMADNRVKNDIQQGRLNSRDVEGIFALGCDDCSETVAVVSADRVADHLNEQRKEGAKHG